MVNYISGLVFVILLVVGGMVVIPTAQSNPGIGVVLGLSWFSGDIIVTSAIQLAAQWERAVVFRLGRFQSIKGPGLFFIVPLVDQLRKLDTRGLAVDIPKQQVI